MSTLDPECVFTNIFYPESGSENSDQPFVAPEIPDNATDEEIATAMALESALAQTVA